MSEDKSGAESLEFWPVENLIPYENNVKEHNEQQIESLAKGIKRFGWDVPIVVDAEGVIIKGHGRRLAALKLGMKQVPVIQRFDMTRAEADAARLNDNKAAMGDFDTHGLEAELKRLQEVDSSLFEDMAFTPKELDFMLEDLTEVDPEFIMDDMNTGLENLGAQTEESLQKAGEKRVGLKTVFGTLTVSGEQAKLIARFLNEIEGETGLEGVEGLCAWIKTKEGD